LAWAAQGHAAAGEARGLLLWTLLLLTTLQVGKLQVLRIGSLLVCAYFRKGRGQVQKGLRVACLSSQAVVLLCCFFAVHAARLSFYLRVPAAPTNATLWVTVDDQVRNRQLSCQLSVMLQCYF
jgi:hypothetical protein